MEYADLTIELAGGAVYEGGRYIGRYTVRVLEEMTPEEAVTVQYVESELQRRLDLLDKRQLDREGLIALGRSLAALILPVDGPAGKPAIREMLARRIAAVKERGGVRIWLRLPRELAGVPWEYAFVERAGGEGMDGFLVLDPRVAIVRQELFGAAPAPTHEGDIRILAALASGPGMPALQLDTELKVLNEAAQEMSGVRVDPVNHATMGMIEPRLAGAAIFHFAGHGAFALDMDERPGTYKGKGYLAFEDARVDPEQLGINLRGNGVCLAVLAGCETGRRLGVSVWSGIAPALIKAEIPAVIANQYTVFDTSAIAFTRRLYQSLAGGLPIERAVSNARIAIYSQDADGRDWGVPVLYLRPGSGALFAGVGDAAARKQARTEAEADVVVRTGKVGAGGIVYGAKVHELLRGKLAVSVTTGDVEGKVIGLIEKGNGSDIQVDVRAGDVHRGGIVIGAEIGKRSEERPTSLRGRRPGKGRRAKPPIDAIGMRVGESATDGAAEPEEPARTNVHTGNVAGGIVVGENNGNVTIYAGDRPENPTIEEKIRLDVALPTTVIIDDPFLVVVAVKQPDAPKLAEAGLDHVESAVGLIFRNEEDETVEYRVEISGAGFTVDRAYYVFRLRPRQSSSPISFQVTATRTGKRLLFVRAFQLGRIEPELVAETRVTIEVQVMVQPK